MQYIPMEDRFWAKVEKTPTCWLWTDTLNEDGYGRISKPRGAGKVMAHRYSYELAYGPYSPDLYVLHHCDNPTCVRPDHLYLGDQFQNMRDMADRKRGNAGLTACRRGHDFTPENTGMDRARGKRFCITCARMKYKRANDKKRQKVSA